MSKISAKSYKFLLNYSKLFWGPLFIWTQCKNVHIKSKKRLRGNIQYIQKQTHHICFTIWTALNRNRTTQRHRLQVLFVFTQSWRPTVATLVVAAWISFC